MAQDHLAFALHFQSALFFALSLRRFYGQSWRWTAVKTLAILFVYAQLLGLAVDLSTLVGIWGV
jgi:hypothetical protein